MVWLVYSNVRACPPQAVASIQHSAAGQQCRYSGWIGLLMVHRVGTPADTARWAALKEISMGLGCAIL
ncbi:MULTISPECIES: hypothetical protein [Paenibacillus]|uniref:hypothetical protein n=1 Tax=Paenibacillus TaxID=44249 RepID=UPI00117CD713|nr:MULTISPECIES: hypothetical protein [Paenibacillus]MCP3747215.1 hypothetical protein [Paenibacillus sp. A3M_27_13]